FKGKIAVSPNDDPAMTGELWRQAGGTAMRMNMQVHLGGTRVGANFVINGYQSWMELDGQPAMKSPTPRAELLAMQHQERVASLVPLLEDKGLTLTALPDTKVDGRPARCVRVSFKG